MALDRGIDQRLDLGRLGDVGGEEGGPAAGAQDGFDHLFAERGVDVVDDDLRAFGRQPLGDAFADAAAGAGHDDGFVLDAHSVSLRGNKNAQV